jgi:hypothetical protein
MKKLTEDQRLRRRQAFWEVLIYIGVMAGLTVAILLDRREVKLREHAFLVGPLAGLLVVGGIEFSSKLTVMIFGRDSLLDRR